MYESSDIINYAPGCFHVSGSETMIQMTALQQLLALSAAPAPSGNVEETPLADGFLIYALKTPLFQHELPPISYVREMGGGSCSDYDSAAC